MGMIEVNGHFFLYKQPSWYNKDQLTRKAQTIKKTELN